MSESLRALRNLLRRDRAEKLRSLRIDAEKHPNGIAPFIAATAFWEEGEFVSAYGFAEANLRREPNDFRMLVICLDYHIRARDSVQIKAYAERVLAARRPARLSRISATIQGVLLLPLRALGIGRDPRVTTDAFDAWIAWAKNYLENHPTQEVHGGI